VVYSNVGQAIAFVNETGTAAGFTAAGPGLFGADVLLAAVYGVYMYTVLQMRLTREFNQVVPTLPISSVASSASITWRARTMPIGGRKVPPVAVEKEHARVASTISGREVDLPQCGTGCSSPGSLPTTARRVRRDLEASRRRVPRVVLRLREVHSGLPG